jgi:hypothetical protein
MVAKRAESEKNKEFISSTDPWFRPITFSVGPDGYLYMLDYYRQHIETPVSIPDDLKADMDFMAGSDMGRIYRVKPANTPYKSVKVNLNAESSIQLLTYLSYENGWYRTHAHRLLLERQDKSVVKSAKLLFNKSKDPRTRLHLLYVLEGLNALDIAVIKKGLHDSSPDVRENALMLAERYSELMPTMLKMLNDSSPRVKLQATLSLGQFKNQKIIAAFSKLIQSQGQNEWLRLAVLSSELGSSPDLLESMVDHHVFSPNPESWKLRFLQDLSFTIAARNNKSQMVSYLNLFSLPTMSDVNVQTAALKGLKLGLTKNGTSKEIASHLKTELAPEVNTSFQTLRQIYSAL